VHNTDILPTLCDLAGVAPLHSAAAAARGGGGALDGVSLASTLFGVGPSGERQDHGAPARSELWLAPAVLRVGRFKLMATNPGTRGMVGAHLPGGWITDPSVDPGWARNLSSSNGAAHCGQLAKNDTSVVRKSAALN
jgi:hypothetical protein